MTTTFTASNGITVRVEPDDDLFLGVAGTEVSYRGEVTKALREFFLHEAGVWVDAETGALVIRRTRTNPEGGRNATVFLDEAFLQIWEHVEPLKPDLAAIAARYFAAHPERKPWHDAKEGEVWAVTTRTGPTVDETALTVVTLIEGLFFEDPVTNTFISVTGDIVSARKIWPTP